MYALGQILPQQTHACGHGCTSTWESLHSALEMSKTQLWPQNCDTVHTGWTKLLSGQWVFYPYIERLLMSCIKPDPSPFFKPPFSNAAALTTFCSSTCTCLCCTCCRISADSELCLFPATSEGYLCTSSSSPGKYSNTWELGTQPVHALSMWLSAYVCTSFFRKLYFTLHQLDE